MMQPPLVASIEQKHICVGLEYLIDECRQHTRELNESAYCHGDTNKKILLEFYGRRVHEITNLQNRLLAASRITVSEEEIGYTLPPLTSLELSLICSGLHKQVLACKRSADQLIDAPAFLNITDTTQTTLLACYTKRASQLQQLMEKLCPDEFIVEKHALAHDAIATADAKDLAPASLGSVAVKG
jgi:hypothetical protein